jgi:DNA-binding response OmpR family regulator
MPTDPKATPRILIVEPDTSLRTALSMMLKLSGYEVHHIGDGREAVPMHQRKPFDVIIAEIVMSEMDGLEILLRLQKHFPMPKFILLSRKTRFPLEVFSKMALQMGAEHLLRKPFRPEQLLTAVRQVLAEE